MLMPICLAWSAREPLPETAVEPRLRAILNFLHLDAEKLFAVRLLTDGHCGLAFIEPGRNPFAIPLSWRAASGLSVSAYLPFGAGGLVSRQALAGGEYLPELLALLRKNPDSLLELAPPQFFCQLDVQKHVLTLGNDWRGFGRMYEYRTAFGSIWSNKMAAALIFAGLPARLDEAALADMAACGMFSGSGTGYAHLRLCDAGVFIEIDALSGKAQARRLRGTPCGLLKAAPEADAVEKAHAAIAAWMRDLDFFRGGERLRLNLSGGRDSRVVGAALLASGLDCEISLCSPPARDAELARELLRLADVQAPVEALARRAAIEEWYAGKGSLPDIAEDFLLAMNSDISVKLFFSWPTAVADTAGTVNICGDQGEVAHNCYYSPQMFEEEKAWLAKRPGPRPSARRIESLVAAISVKSFGVTAFCGRQAAANIRQNVLEQANVLGLEGFYSLDFLYLYLYLNRQWPGANGAFDRKTPLTVYPYARNGFNQSLEDKLNSRFVRDVVASFLPAWRDAPFFHELPQEETEDFYVAYPTYWEMGRGGELLEICEADGNVWRFFDRDRMLETFAGMLDKELYASLPHRKTSAINTAAQKLLWLVAIERNLEELNRASFAVSDQCHAYL